jgi:CO/xanthine dehydrogenase FAD-binding subunit
MLRLHSYSYERPPSLEQALHSAADAPAGFMFIAGGTDLVPNMKHRLFTRKN